MTTTSKTVGNRTCHVAAGVITDRSGRILLTRRPLPGDHSGLWEFPGGKVESGEGARAALARELREELGIIVDRSWPLIRVRHAAADKSVLLDVWRVTEFRGHAYGREGQPLAWIPKEQLTAREVPPADRPVITAARLPSVYGITPAPNDLEDFIARLTCLVQAGTRLIQLRATMLDDRTYRALAVRALSICRAAGTELLLNAAPELALELGAAGVHLNSRRLRRLEQRPLSGAHWVAASCHDAEELHHAQAIGVDFVVIAPVWATASHPEAKPLGFAGLQALTELASVPVYALGGMRAEHIGTAQTNGAQGIATVSAWWDAATSAPRLRQLFAADE